MADAPDWLAEPAGTLWRPFPTTEPQTYFSGCRFLAAKPFQVPRSLIPRPLTILAVSFLLENLFPSAL